jgi:hypothetical protein
LVEDDSSARLGKQGSGVAGGLDGENSIELKTADGEDEFVVARGDAEGGASCWVSATGIKM